MRYRDPNVGSMFMHILSYGKLFQCCSQYFYKRIENATFLVFLESFPHTKQL